MDGVRELWRFLRLLGVGLIWSAPLLPITFVNTNPGVAAHPRLAAALEPLLDPAMLAAPMLAVVGVALVAWLSPLPRSLTPASAVPVLVFGGIALAAFLFMTDRIAGGGLAFAAVAMFAAVLLPLIGLGTTMRTLWRRSRLLAACWLLVWLALGAVVILGTRANPEMGDDLGGGLLGVFLIAGVLAADLVASVVAFVVAGIIGTHRTSGSS